VPVEPPEMVAAFREALDRMRAMCP